MAQNYTKIVADTNFSDSLLKKILCVHDSLQILDTIIFVEKFSPSLHIERILNPKKQKNTEQITDSFHITGYATRNASNGNNKGFSTSAQTDITLEGFTSGIDITAKIKDSDMPVSADGTSAQISELAEMYISAEKNGLSFLAGDFTATQNNSQFNNFSKKIKGFQVSAAIKGSEKVDSVFFNTDFAIAKGKFRRQRIIVYSYSQGPYYLTSADSTPTIVLVGTEKIWLDEKLLSRGTDYTIDYNSGTIYFSIQCPISSQSRVIVDFQYGAQSRANYFVNANGGIKINNTKISVGYLAGIDSKNKLTSLNSAEQTVFATDSSSLPKSNEYFSIKLDQDLGKNSTLNTEFITSQHCDNRLFPQTNNGYAGSSTFQRKFLLNDRVNKLDIMLDYKFKVHGFSAYEIDKNPKILEQWNIYNYNDNKDEQMAQFMLSYNKDTIAKARYFFNLIDISSLFNGISNKVEINVYKKQFSFETFVDAGRVKHGDSISNTLKTNFLANVYFNKFTLGTAVYIRNINNLQIADNNDNNYYGFDLILSKSEKKSSIKLIAQNKFIYTNYNKLSFKDNYEKKITTKYDAQFSEKIKISTTSVFLMAKNTANYDTIAPKTATLTGQASAIATLCNKRLNFITNYESTAGREEKAGFVFLKTAQGRGYYVWNDYNNDGIQDLNEFEQAYYQCDADYAKYYVHTGEFIATITQKYKFTATWNGITDNKGNLINKFVNRFNENINYSISNKSALNPQVLFSLGDSTITRNNNISLFTKFNATKFLSLQHIYNYVQNQNLTIYGRDGSKSYGNKYSIITECNPIEFSINVEKNINSVFSEFFDSKNYSIDELKYSFDIKIFQDNWENGFKYSNLVKILSDSCHNTINNFIAYTQYSKPKFGNINLTLNLVFNKYLQSQSATVNYEMLQGLSNGRNFITTLTIAINATKHLQLTTFYQMRKPQNNTAIHTGNIGVRLIMDN